MIGYLKGTILHSDLKSVVLEVGGVGYKIYTNTALLEGQKTKETIFWTYLAVRENALDLYGFSTREELAFFELLLTVSGIGPKSAITILSIASVKTIKQAVSLGDSSRLVKVSGVGRKNAEKIVLELKDKIGDYTSDGTESSGDSDAIEALKSLGYSEKESREALKKANGESIQEKVKSALKNLNK